MPRAPGPPTALRRVSGPGALVVLVDGGRSPPGRSPQGSRPLRWSQATVAVDAGVAPAWPSSPRTSLSRYRRWPPGVRSEVSLPALAHRVTVLGSTRKRAATSAGVNSASASTVRLVMGSSDLSPADVDLHFRTTRPWGEHPD